MIEPSARAAIGRTPVAGDLPAGESAVDDAQFEALRAEVLKDPVREVTDWAKVIPLAVQILEKRSKDFTAASYLAVALLEKERFAGLLDGLRLLEGLFQTFWDNGFPQIPKRLRGRANAIQWMAERCSTWVERRGAEAADRDALLACAQACTDLDKAIAERFTDGDVGVGALARALRDQLDRLPEPQAGGTGRRRGAHRLFAENVLGECEPGRAEIRSQSDAQLLVFKTAAFLRQKEATSPTPYRLVRVFRWSGIASAPPATDGKTQIVPPAAETLALLRRLAEAREWGGLLEEAEAAFQQGSPLWLDLQRLSVAALDGLGPGYLAARDGVLGEVRGLLRRIPSLPDLRFRDDAPFADPETRVWLAEDLGEEPAGAAAPDRAAAAPAAGVDAEALAKARQEARRLVKDGDLRGALEALSGSLGEAGSPRAQFLARLEVAVLCTDLGRERIAVPMLEALDEAIGRHGLEAWEPALATRVLEAMYRSCKRLAGQRGAPPALAGRVEELFARLCRIDPAAAAGID